MVSVGTLAAVILLWHAVSGTPPDFDDWRFWMDATAPLALAAMSQTIVLLSGGQALAAGSIAIFVNALIALFAGEDCGSMLFWLIAGPATGGLLGLANGALIAYARLPSTSVTLATGFAVQGLTLLLIEGHSLQVPEVFTAVLIDGRLMGFLPTSVVLLAVAGIFWAALSRTRFDRLIRVLARHEAAATRAGADIRRLRALCYAIAGAGYGLTGVLLAAQLGSVDPLAGAPFLLQIYAAVVIGGTVLRLRQGDALGSLIGAFVLTGTLNVMLAAGIPLYWSSAADAAWLVLGSGFAMLPALGRIRSIRWPAALRIGAPACTKWPTTWLLLLAAALVGDVVLPGTMLSVAQVNDYLLISLMMSVLALGLGASILSGGIDLSMPSIVAAAGLVFVALLQGSDAALPWAFGCVAIGGTLVGLLNGVGIARFGIPPALMTLASSGLVVSLGAFATISLPMGFASPGLSWFMTARVYGLSPAVWILLPACIGLASWLQRQHIGVQTHVFAQRGVLLATERRLLLAIYGLSGFLAATGGALLAGYGGGLARMGQADVYLLPTLLAVSLAGINIGTASGQPLGILAAVASVTLFDTFLVRIDLSFAERLTVLGLVLLISIGIGAKQSSIRWARRDC